MAYLLLVSFVEKGGGGMRWMLAVALMAALPVVAAPVSEPLPVFAAVTDEPYVPIAVVCGGDTFLANAVFVNRELRLFVTNAHVIGGSPTAAFLWLGAHWIPVRFGDFVDVENDIALVQAESIPSGYRALALPFSREPLQLGDVLLVVGAQLEPALERRPSGYVLMHHSWPYVVALPRTCTCVTGPSCGEVLKSYLQAFLKLSMTTTERHKLGNDYAIVLGVSRRSGRMLRPGLSGSPALDYAGSIAGIVSAIVEGRGDVAIFAPASIAAELVERAKVALNVGGSE